MKSNSVRTAVVLLLLNGSAIKASQVTHTTKLAKQPDCVSERKEAKKASHWAKFNSRFSAIDDGWLARLKARHEKKLANHEKEQAKLKLNIAKKEEKKKDLEEKKKALQELNIAKKEEKKKALEEKKKALREEKLDELLDGTCRARRYCRNEDSSQDDWEDIFNKKCPGDNNAPPCIPVKVCYKDNSSCKSSKRSCSSDSNKAPLCVPICKRCEPRRCAAPIRRKCEPKRCASPIYKKREPKKKYYCRPRSVSPKKCRSYERSPSC